MKTIDNVDFYSIKDYDNYLISKCGKIYSLLTDKISSPKSDNNEYIYKTMKHNSGIYVRWPFHRLLAWVFQADCGDIDGLVVNHIDGVKSNNDLSNLELITVTENNHHAGRLKLTTKCKQVSITHTLTGEMHKFNSGRECSRFLGISKDLVLARCHKGEDKIFSDFYRYKFDWDDFKPVKTNRLTILMDRGRCISVVVRYVLTGEVLEFDSCRELAKHLNCSEGFISQRLRDKTQPILMGWIQVQPVKTMVDWVDHDDVVANYQDNNNCRCVCLWDKDNNMEIFYTAVEAARSIDIKPTAMNYRLQSKGNIVFKDGTKCSYYSDWVSSCGNT